MPGAVISFILRVNSINHDKQGPYKGKATHATRSQINDRILYGRINPFWCDLSEERYYRQMSSSRYISPA